MYARDLNTLAAFAEDWCPAVLQPVRRGRAGPIARATSPILNVVFGDATVVPKSPPLGGSPGIDGSQNATSLLVGRLPASSPELRHVGK